MHFQKKCVPFCIVVCQRRTSSHALHRTNTKTKLNDSPGWGKRAKPPKAAKLPIFARLASQWSHWFHRGRQQRYQISMNVCCFPFSWLCFLKFTISWRNLTFEFLFDLKLCCRCVVIVFKPAPYNNIISQRRLCVATPISPNLILYSLFHALNSVSLLKSILNFLVLSKTSLNHGV